MNELAERALVQLLAANGPLVALVGDAISWDDEELDPPIPGVTMRSLTARINNTLGSRLSLRHCLVDIAAHAQTRTACSQLADVIVAALDPYQGRTTVDVSGTPLVFASILLDDVQQSTTPRPRDYRKSTFYSVSFYG